MTLHPCANHACDHCHLCDNLGICCASVPNSAATVLLATRLDTSSMTYLRNALADDVDNGRINGSDLRVLADQTPQSIEPPMTSLAALQAPDDRLALPSATGDAVVLQFARKSGNVRHLDVTRRRAENRQ